MITKKEARELVEAIGVNIERITKRGNVIRVKIDWKDYPKVRHLISRGIDFTFRLLP